MVIGLPPLTGPRVDPIRPLNPTPLLSQGLANLGAGAMGLGDKLGAGLLEYGRGKGTEARAKASAKGAAMGQLEAAGSEEARNLRDEKILDIARGLLARGEATDLTTAIQQAQGIYGKELERGGATTGLLEGQGEESKQRGRKGKVEADRAEETAPEVTEAEKDVAGARSARAKEDKARAEANVKAGVPDAAAEGEINKYKLIAEAVKKAGFENTIIEEQVSLLENTDLKQKQLDAQLAELDARIRKAKGSATDQEQLLLRRQLAQSRSFLTLSELLTKQGLAMAQIAGDVEDPRLKEEFAGRARRLFDEAKGNAAFATSLLEGDGGGAEGPQAQPLSDEEISKLQAGYPDRWEELMALPPTTLRKHILPRIKGAAGGAVEGEPKQEGFGDAEPQPIPRPSGPRTPATFDPLNSDIFRRDMNRPYRPLPANGR